jgi:prefoldin subunit 5
MIKLTSVIRTLEEKREELQKEIRNVDVALAALSSRGREMAEDTRQKISRAVSRAWKKRKKKKKA